MVVDVLCGEPCVWGVLCWTHSSILCKDFGSEERGVQVGREERRREFKALAP